MDYLKGATRCKTCRIEEFRVFGFEPQTLNPETPKPLTPKPPDPAKLHPVALEKTPHRSLNNLENPRYTRLYRRREVTINNKYVSTYTSSYCSSSGHRVLEGWYCRLISLRLCQGKGLSMPLECGPKQRARGSRKGYRSLRHLGLRVRVYRKLEFNSKQRSGDQILSPPS